MGLSATPPTFTPGPEMTLPDYMALTGISFLRDGIDAALNSGHRLDKAADPTEGAREGLSADEAEAIALEDPSLVIVAENVCTLPVAAKMPADLVAVLAASMTHGALSTGPGHGLLIHADRRPDWLDEPILVRRLSAERGAFCSERHATDHGEITLVLPVSE